MQSTSAVSVMYFPTTMRTGPAAVATNGTSYWYIEQPGGGVDAFDTIGLDTANPERCRLTATGNVSGTQGTVGWGATNNAAARLAFDAEL
jgi:hypothetical protein